jgi:hypothetical protein
MLDYILAFRNNELIKPVPTLIFPVLSFFPQNLFRHGRTLNPEITVFHLETYMKDRFFIIAVLILMVGLAKSQDVKPVTWRFTALPGSGNDAMLVLTAQIDPGWQMYSQKIVQGGPMPTRVSFEPSKDFELLGETTEEGARVESFDRNFNRRTIRYSNAVSFVQKIKLHKLNAKISGRIEFMLCTAGGCTAPEDITIELTVTNAAKPEKNKSKTNTG